VFKHSFLADNTCGLVVVHQVSTTETAMRGHIMSAETDYSCNA